MAQAFVAMQSARMMLNDDSSISWTDAVLFPKVQEAHRELSMQLNANGIQVTKQQSAIISVPAIVGNPPLALPSQPSNLVTPIDMFERAVGENYDDFIEMDQKDFIPPMQPDEELLYWAWDGQIVYLVGATSDREVLLRYVRSFATVNMATDDLGFIYAELYVGPRAASLAYASIGDKRWQIFKAQADSNLYDIIGMNVKTMQGVGTSRKGYRRSGLRRIL